MLRYINDENQKIKPHKNEINILSEIYFILFYFYIYEYQSDITLISKRYRFPLK